MTSHWMQIPTGNDQYNYCIFKQTKLYTLMAQQSLQAAKATCAPRDTRALCTRRGYKLTASREITSSKICMIP